MSNGRMTANELSVVLTDMEALVEAAALTHDRVSEAIACAFMGCADQLVAGDDNYGVLGMLAVLLESTMVNTTADPVYLLA